MKTLSKKEILFIGFMLFSMLFGAGNLIFPAFLGQAAGENMWKSIFGFIFSDATLSILAFIAIAKAGSFDTLAKRVHPIFAFLFPMAIYLAIGPGLAIPRAGSLAYEMGLQPFLPISFQPSPIGLLIYTVLFFSVVFWFAKSPTKLVERFGKFLTPVLLVLISVVFFKGIITNLPSFSKPTYTYLENPISQGFLDGYQTMDAIGALIYGIVFINIFRQRGIKDQNSQSKYLAKIGVIGGLLLSVVYVIIAYLGASAHMPHPVDNGAEVLSTVLQQLFGNSGIFVLGLLFTLACLSVCIGLITSCAQYFNSILPKFSYTRWVVLLCIVSGLVANLGLSQILKISVPVLGILYPIAISLIILGLIHQKLTFNGKPVYGMTISFVGLFSLIDIANISILNNYFSTYLNLVPFYKQGFGWILPGVIGFIFGSFIQKIIESKNSSSSKIAA